MNQTQANSGPSNLDGMNLILQGRLEQARVILMEVIQSSDSAEHRNNLGFIYIVTG